MSIRYDKLASATAASGIGETNPPDQPAGTSFGRRALDALYRSQAGRLLRLFNKRTDPQDAADLVQETFVRYAHATLEREASPDCPESYLTQVAVNVLNDRGRSPARRAALYSIPIEDAGLTSADEVAAIEARDLLQRVEAIILLLKPMTRDIFIARRIHGFSRAEIAEQTGLSVKAVDKHLGRAFDHLRRHLGDHDAE
ncbi:RNA polymerase sigma factor [Novosphingobium rosa]|uniref:RNA polymerase sigma factor n=1 Tax=Novosphingobium rosa TaxID=76978 RepID=UPI001472163B|nr:sigma-70 family RNA polymerase sigma factor [Novosphingobium rosa]